jgi:hypothetical protein
MTLSDMAMPITTAPAQRLRKPSWRDPKLVIGLLLLFGSLALGARVVAQADNTRPVFAARAVMPTGTPLTADLLQVVRLRLTGTSAPYLDARKPLPQGMVVLRTIGAGELVPLGSLAAADQLLERPVTIPLDGPVPTGLSAGGRVDVWAAGKRRDAVGGGYDDPQRIAEMVEVFDLSDSNSALTSDRSGSVDVLLPAETLPSVLAAMANDARITVLPVLGAGSGSGADGGKTS